MKRKEKKVERIRCRCRVMFSLFFFGVANGVVGVEPLKIEILLVQSYNSTHYTTETTWEFHLTVSESNIYNYKRTNNV